MSLTTKPLWLEGMFIRPQHMQQQNRYLEALLERRVSWLQNASWGLCALALDRDLLRVGKFGVTSCRVIMPDGTPIAIPEDMESPPARDVPSDIRRRVVKLAIPARRGDGLEVPGGGQIGAPRFTPVEQEVHDSTNPERRSAAVTIGALRAHLLLEGESEDDLITLPLARVDQVEANGLVSLSTSFLPPSLDCAAVLRFGEIIREIEGLLHSLGETVAGRVNPSRLVNQMAGILDYLLLTTINRFQPVFAEFGRTKGFHPQELHHAVLQLAGELATFGLKVRRPAIFPPYSHEDLEATFAPPLDAIRHALAIVIDERVVSLTLERREHGIWIGPIGDHSLLRTARFVLAAKSSMPEEAMRSRFPMQVKLGPVEIIRDLVNLQIPGIVLDPLSVAPRELPYYSGYTYFDLAKNNEIWSRLANSAAFALHVGADFTELALELWAIREVSE
jgi:type VI secretion system protein ImpJ